MSDTNEQQTKPGPRVSDTMRAAFAKALDMDAQAADAQAIRSAVHAHIVRGEN